MVPAETVSVTASGLEIVHARADVILAESFPKAPHPSIAPESRPYLRTLDETYGAVLFHGKDLCGITRIDGCSDQGISAQVASAPPPRDWLASPPRGSWLADPLALDAVFQLLIVWSHDRHGLGSLPCYLGRYRQYRRSFPKEGLQVSARVVKDSPGLAVSEVEVLDAAGALVATLQGYECVIDPSLKGAFRRNQAVPSFLRG